MKKIINFIKNLLDETNTSIDMKTIVTLLSIIGLFICLFINFRGKQVDSELIYSFAALAGGGTISNVASGFINRNK